ncbi:hypothetical protein JCM10212_001879 [Sporobolomyces blumeae]
MYCARQKELTRGMLASNWLPLVTVPYALTGFPSPEPSSSPTTLASKDSATPNTSSGATTPEPAVPYEHLKWDLSEPLYIDPNFDRTRGIEIPPKEELDVSLAYPLASDLNAYDPACRVNSTTTNTSSTSDSSSTLPALPEGHTRATEAETQAFVAWLKVLIKEDSRAEAAAERGAV